MVTRPTISIWKVSPVSQPKDETNTDTYIANKSAFWKRILALADSQRVPVLHILADKAYRYLDPPPELQARFQIHLLGIPQNWNAARHPQIRVRPSVAERPCDCRTR
jgi:hypothetical protein